MHFSSFLFFYNWRPPLFVIPIRAIYDPEVEIPDSSDSSKTPPGEEEDRVEFPFASEPSDSSDLDMMKGPRVKRPLFKPSTRFSKQAPKSQASTDVGNNNANKQEKIPTAEAQQEKMAKGKTDVGKDTESTQNKISTAETHPEKATGNAEDQMQDQALQQQIEQDIRKGASQDNNDKEEQSKAATENEFQRLQGTDQGTDDQTKASDKGIQADLSKQADTHKPEDQNVGDAGAETQTTDPLSIEGLEKLEKENPLSALDSFLATFASAPSPASSSSMAESHASQLLQDFKAEVFDHDLLEILDQDPTAYKDILSMIKGVQKLRVGTEISSFLVSFEYMLNAAATQSKNKKTYQEILNDQRGKSERTFSSIQEVRDKISDNEKQLTALDQRKAVLDAEIEALEKKLEELKKERVSLIENHGKLAEDVKQKTQEALQSAKTLIDLREAIVDSENRFDTTCQRLVSIRTNYEDLKARCPF